MFKKLKDKITEEVKQSPLKFQASVQQLAQAVAPSVVSSTSEPASNDHFVISEDDPVGAFEPEKFKNAAGTKDDDGMATLSLSRRSSLSSVTNDLFPIYESPSVFNQFQSDLESTTSEVEELFTSSPQLDYVSKEKLYAACRTIQARYHKYKGRYTDVKKHYRILEKENEKVKTILSETQDKALRRIAELKEQCQLEQKAKAHLEESLRNDIEERDHLINSLNTKIGYLRDGNDSSVETESPSKTNESSGSLSTSPSDIPSVRPPVPSEGDTKLKENLKKLEELLQKSKGVITEKINIIADLRKENAELKSEVNQLATAKDEVISLRALVGTLQKSEEEVALSIAESKRSIFLELESKETQIKKLKATLTDTLQEKTQLCEKIKNLEAKVQSSEEIADKVAQVQREMDVKLTSTKQNFTSVIKEKDNLMERLKEENIVLQEELRSKITELKEMKKTIERLTESSENKLSLKESEISSLKENLSKVQDEISLLKSSNFDDILKQNKSDDCKMQSEKRSEAVKEESFLLDEEPTHLVMPPEENKSLNELKNAIELLKKELAAKESKLRHINEHSANNSSKLSETLEKVNQMENGFLTKREEWMQMKVQYQKQIDNYLAEIQKLKEDVEHLNMTCEQKEQKVTEYDLVIANLNDSLTDLREKLSLKSQENDGLQNEVSDLNDKIKTYVSESEKVNQIKKQVASLTSELETKNSEVDKLNQDVDTKALEIENSLKKNSELLNEVDSLTKVVREKDSSLSELKNCLVESEGKFESEKASLKILNDELMSKLKNLEETLASKEVETQNHKTLVTNLENTISALKQQLESNSSNADEIKLLQLKVSELQKKNEESSTKLQQYENDLTEVSAKLQDSELKLQKTEKMKSELEADFKEKKKECASYINDHNEMIKIKDILDNSHLSVKTTISELIIDLIKLNHSASDDKNTLEKLKSEVEVFKENEKKWQNTFMQSLDALRKAKQDILYLKQELTKAVKFARSDCSKLVDDCLNYSIKFVEDKKRHFDETMESFKCRETELNCKQSELNEKIKCSEENINAKSATIEAQDRKISELTSSVQNLEATMNETSNLVKEAETNVMTKDKIIDDLNSKVESLSDIENRYLLQLGEKDSEIAAIKAELEQFESQKTAGNSDENEESVQHLKDLNTLLSQELQKYEGFEKKWEKEKLISENLAEELQDAKQDYEKLESEFELLRQTTLAMEGELKEKVELNSSHDLQVEIEHLERRHEQEILEIEKRYAALLAEKYKEYEVLQAKYHEQELGTERRLNMEVREIMKDAKETEELQSEQLEKFHLQLKQTEEEANAKVKQLKQEHIVQMDATVKKWKDFLDKKLAELKQKHSDEVAALTEEWNHERKTNCDFVAPSNAASGNQELEALANSSGDEKGTLESLNIQIKALNKELDEEKNLHRLEVQELQKLLSKRNSGRRSKEPAEQDIEDCTEMEYLRNILYEYMMGKEPVVLARVLAALVKFDSEQTIKVLQKEEQRFSLLGQLGMS